MRKKLMLKNNKKGFTLVELLVTMVIVSVMGLGAFTMMIMATRNFDNANESNTNQQYAAILETRLHNSVSTATYVSILEGNTNVKKGDLALCYDGGQLTLYEITGDSQFLDSGNKKVNQIFLNVPSVTFDIRMTMFSSYKLDYNIETDSINVIQGGLIINNMKTGDTIDEFTIDENNNTTKVPYDLDGNGIIEGNEYKEVLGILIRPSDKI